MKNKINRVFVKRFAFIFGLLCSGLLGSLTINTVAYAQGKESFLKADGKVLRNNDGKGDIITLHGTNVGGWQVMESWMCPTNASDQKTAIQTLTERFGKEKADELIKIYEKSWWQERDFDNVKDLNFNVLRLPISYYNLLDENGKLREDTLATYDWFVKECEERDIYVILDLHAAPGSQNGRDHSGDKSGSKLFTDEAAQNLTVSLWEQLAEHYRGNSTIAGFDLLNEAEGNEKERAPWGAVQLPFFDRLYKAIRAIDPDHIIILNAVWEPTNIPDPSEYGWENIMYEYHYYWWEGTDNAVTQRNFTNSKVANNNKAGHDVPVLIGEFTLFDKLPSWEHAFQVYEENGWSWTTWTYKTVDQGNWGIFNSKSSITPDVNIYNDSAETIEKKWSKIDTETSFTKNKYLYDLFKVAADKEAAKGNPRKWYQNVTGEVELRAGADAEAKIVSGSEISSDKADGEVICLTVTESERIPTATSRNVCISPMIRDSVDATGLDYLIFSTYSTQGNRALNITLVDKSGATWSNYTSSAAMPISYHWEKVFLDISNVTIDISAITEIRIGVNAPGTYYFDDIYFAGSFADLLPNETEEAIRNDMGVKGIILDWVDVPESGSKNREKVNWPDVILVMAAVIIILTIGLRFMIHQNPSYNTKVKKKKRRNRMKVITTRYENNQKVTAIKEYDIISEEKGVEMQVVNIYPDIEYQTFHGFGGAITEASGFAFSKLGKENQEKVLEYYFGAEGNRYNMARGHIDSCDFSLGNYSAMTDPNDLEMKSFTLKRDEQYIFPLLNAAQEKRGEAFDLLLSPWSPPAFMKTNEEKNHGGKLKPEFREFWAQYICRYIKEYEKRGYTVNRLTVQNEPAAVQSWDSCIFTAEDEKVFIRDFLYPALVKNGLSDVKINIWDHNKERMYERAMASIDKDTDKMIDGIAFHWYSGDHFDAINITHEAFPGKELLFTEGCVEYSRFGTSQLQNAQMYAHDIIGNLNGGMTGFFDWNIFLDEKGGPNHVGNFCDAPIMIDTVNDSFEVKLSFDYIGHFSRYIKKGAKRIALTKYTDKLEITAFKNPEGSIVLVALNRNEQDMPITIRLKGGLGSFVVPKNAIATVVL